MLFAFYKLVEEKLLLVVVGGIGIAGVVGIVVVALSWILSLHYKRLSFESHHYFVILLMLPTQPSLMTLRANYC